MNDIQPFVVADAVADFSAEEHAMALRWASRSGVASTTDGLLRDLLIGRARPAHDGPSNSGRKSAIEQARGETENMTERVAVAGASGYAGGESCASRCHIPAWRSGWWPRTAARASRSER